MSQKADVHALWISGAFLLLTGVAVVLLASRPPSAAADAPIAQLEGVSCEMSSPVSAGASVEELMQQVIEQRVRNGQDQAGDYVVLNNRGYNYGPAPGIDFDALMKELGTQAH